MRAAAAEGSSGSLSLSRPRVLLKLWSISIPRSLVALLGVSAIFLVAWSLAVPVFEAPDEPAHWDYARYVHDHHALPEYSAAMVEANEPPLYYILISPLASRVSLPHHLAYVDGLGRIQTPFPPRFFQNSDDDFTRYWPIRAARLLSALIAVIGVLFCYLAALEATGSPPTAFLAGGIMAFLPEFTFRNMNVSADTLVTTMCAAALYLIVRIVRRGFTWQTGMIAAAVMSGAFLSKTSAMYLPIPYAIAVLSDSGRWSVRWLRLTLTGAVALAIAVPWLLRNQVMYGDPLAEHVMKKAVSYLVVEKSITSPYFLNQFPSWLAQSFVAFFGWMNVPPPHWVYAVFLLLALVSAFGCLWGMVQRRLSVKLLLILLTAPILCLGIVIYINLTFTQPQGRYLFPALAAFAVLAALGIQNLPRWSQHARLGSISIVAALAALNAYVLSSVVIPAYWPPPFAHVSTASTVVGVAHMSGLAAAPAEREIITNADPSLLLAAPSFGADRYTFLTFDIQGKSSSPNVTGGVYFAAKGRPITESQQVYFAWSADGASHSIVVALAAHPAWHGTITAIRVDPINFDVQSHLGMRLRMSNFQLVGSLPSETDISG